MGEQPLLKVGTFDESSIIVESTPPGQQVKVSETNQELVTSQNIPPTIDSLLVPP
jgi:hypothetical protein